MPISYSEQVTLSCPACTQDFNTDVWMIVDVAERPDLAQALEDGSLDRVVCPHCGTTGPAGAPLLYHDPARRAIYFAVPPDVDEHLWREQAQSLLYLLFDHLPEAARQPYLSNVQVEMDVAGLRRALLRRPRRGAGAKARSPEPPPAPAAAPPADEPDHAPILDAVQALLAADTPEEFRAVVQHHPALLSPTADATFSQLSVIAEQQGEREVAQALRAARSSLVELRGLVEPQPSPGDAAPLTPLPEQLTDAAYQRLMRAHSVEEVLDAARDYPSLLEPWADATLVGRVESALEEGGERLAHQIDARREALATLRAQLLDEAALLASVRALLAAEDDDARAALISDHPALLTDATQDALFGLAAGARSQGDDELAEYAVACRAMLRRVRIELEQGG
jgi:hypothetical protein